MPTQARPTIRVATTWSRAGNKFKGAQEIAQKWKSFKTDVPHPITIATILKMVSEGGVDYRDIYGEIEYPFEKLETDDAVASPVVASGTPQSNRLDRYSLRGMSSIIEKQAVEQVPILGLLALKGQATIIYAAPNTGKTLITLSLLIEAISAGKLDPAQLYYINVDDTSKGLAEKNRIAEEYGFNMLADGYRDFTPDSFLTILNELLELNQASTVIVVLDTLKKFVDLMDKTKSSRFTKVIRRFVIKGGTFIGLAHTNKHLGRDGKPVYGGTSEMIDDSDCVYISWEIASENGEKTVEFENRKRRGNVIDSVAFKYSTDRGISYGELLASVRTVDEADLVPLRQAAQMRSDTEVIEAVLACIKDGINTKMRLADAVAKRAGVSKRSAIQLIDKYTGVDPAVHRWMYTVCEHGAQKFSALSTASTAPVSDQPTQ